METTLEEARRCPKCEQPGELVAEAIARGATMRGARLQSFACRNPRCKWHDTICRIVQVNPDGSIPPPVMKREKQYPARPDLTKQVNDQIERQLGLELNGGAEVTR